MSDELITYVIGQLRGACWEEEAAAVEALVQERDAAEAKLVKAVEVLQWYADFGNYLSNRGDYAPIDLDKGGKAEDTLAELEVKE